MLGVELTVGGWFASAAISKLIEKLDKYIQDQHERWKDVRAKLEELKSLLIELNKINGDADWAENVDRTLQLRLGQLRDAVCDAENLLYWMELKRSDMDMKDLEAVSDRLKNIAEQDFSKLPNHPPVASTCRRTTSIPTASQLFGRDKEKKSLLEMVITDDDDDDGKSSSNFKVIAIVGMGGLGKTVLAQHVFDDESIKNRFENLTVWVCVTHSHDVDLTSWTTKAVIRKLEVLRKLEPISTANVTDTTDSLNTQQETLREHLKGERFLIVLDDVWNLEPDEWQKLCAPFRSAMKGSRFILTTRNPGLVRRLPAIQTVSLKEIQRSSYLDLFKRRAFVDADPSDYPELVSIGTEIVNRLNGSPSAAETVGAELRSKLDAKHWRSVRDGRLCDIKQDEYGIIPSLRLTYMLLPARLKQCFAFGALFPLNYVFESSESLVSMWIAQGFVQSSGSKNAEETGMDYFDELLDISFFQHAKQGNKNGYVINTLLHEVAWSISNTEYCVFERNKTVRIPDKLRHLCVVGKTLPDVWKDKKKMERLRSLVLLQSGDFNFNTNNREMFSKLKSLRLLIISGCADKLPSTIMDNLKHLPYLRITTKTASSSSRAEIGFSSERRPQKTDQPATSNGDHMSGFPTKWPSLSK